MDPRNLTQEQRIARLEELEEDFRRRHQYYFEDQFAQAINPPTIIFRFTRFTSREHSPRLIAHLTGIMRGLGLPVLSITRHQGENDQIYFVARFQDPTFIKTIRFDRSCFVRHRGKRHWEGRHAGEAGQQVMFYAWIATPTDLTTLEASQATQEAFTTEDISNSIFTTGVSFAVVYSEDIDFIDFYLECVMA